MSVQLYVPAALPSGKIPWYPTKKSQGGPLSWYGHFAGETNILSPQESNHDSSVHTVNIKLPPPPHIRTLHLDTIKVLFIRQLMH
jgi:hypothetical protein